MDTPEHLEPIAGLTQTASVEGAVSVSPTAPPASVAPHGNLGAGARRIWGWVDDRLGFSALRYPVPAHANTFWYTLGGITFIGLIVLVITGIWLAQYYSPDLGSARQSVLYIQNQAPFGGIIRGIHVWTAYLVAITAALHLIRIFITAAYKAPRELNWIVGVVLLGLVLFGGIFTGTVLRWDQEAFEALEHNTEVAQLLGTIGGFFSHGFTTSVSILPSLYAAHVSIVPLILILLLVAHIFLIKHHGIAPTAAQADAGEAPDGKLPKEKQTGHYPTHLRLMLGYGMALVAFAGMLGLLFPPAIGAAPVAGMEVTKPPFLFYWNYAFEDWFGVKGILYSTIGFFGLLTVLPFIDRTPLRRLRQRKVALVIGVVLLVGILALSIMVAVQPPAKHLGM